MSRSKKLQKSLQDCLNKIKIRPTPNLQFPSPQSFSSSKNWILSGCKHTKTLSFTVDDTRRFRASQCENGAAATLSDIDRFLFENFKSLYIEDEGADDDGEPDHLQLQSPRGAAGVLFDSPLFVNPPPDLCGSHRFFVAPGVSGSLMEEARRSSNTTLWDEPDGDGGGGSFCSSSTSTSVVEPPPPLRDMEIPRECVALLKYSANPYDDFLRSMEEMVVERVERGGAGAQVDWDFMEELLFCYLNLNDQKSYKFILSAFVDLVVDLRRRVVPERSRTCRRRRRRHVSR